LHSAAGHCKNFLGFWSKIFNIVFIRFVKIPLTFDTTQAKWWISLNDQIPAIQDQPLVQQPIDSAAFTDILEVFS
jgi:hypothetical protein